MVIFSSYIIYINYIVTTRTVITIRIVVTSCTVVTIRTVDLYGFYNSYRGWAFCCVLPATTANLLQNVRFMRIANHHRTILLPRSHSLQQIAANYNSMPEKKILIYPVV